MNETTTDDAEYMEWRCWQLVCQELRKLGLDVNNPKCDTFVHCVQAWGELLVELRVGQTDIVRDNARLEAMYKLVTDGIEVRDDR